LLGTNAFSPSQLTVQVGDTVHWVWITGTHNVVSGVGGVQDANFDSGNAVAGATFDVTFDQAFLDANSMPGNEYPYYCEPHLPVGMIGTITVSPGVPTVSEWGVAILALLVLAVATVMLSRHTVLFQHAD
jgi:plastocyanin